MRLVSYEPHIPLTLISILEQCGIRTDNELLFGRSILDIYRSLPAQSITLQELSRYKDVVAGLASAPGKTLEMLLKDEDETEELAFGFLTGLPDVDSVLEGLTFTRRIVEISGDRRSGKTSFLLHLVLRHLSTEPSSSILWIDTTGEFSPHRAQEMAKSFDAPDALSRLQLSNAFEVDAVQQVIAELASSLSEPNPISTTRTRAIVIDSLTPLILPLLSPVSSQGHAIMTGLLRQLRTLAQTYSIAVFLVNNSTPFTPFVSGSAQNNPKIRKPALGPSFAFLTDATIWLAASDKRTELDERVHVLEVYHTKVTPPRPLASFIIRHVLSPCEDKMDYADS